MKYFNHVLSSLYYYYVCVRVEDCKYIISLNGPKQSRLPYRPLVLITTTLSSSSEELIVSVSIGKHNGSMNDTYYINHSCL